MSIERSNRSPPRVRRTFDTRKDALASRSRGMWRPGIASEPDAWISQEARDTGVLPQRLRVLVIDHDTRAADTLEQLLHATGYPETRVAYTGRGAVVFVQEFRPEVVLMDIDMPDVDESALNRTLRDRAHLRHLYLIAVAGPRVHEKVRIERDAASTPCLFKPVTARDLSACLLRAAAAVR